MPDAMSISTGCRDREQSDHSTNRSFRDAIGNDESWKVRRVFFSGTFFCRGGGLATSRSWDGPNVCPVKFIHTACPMLTSNP
jgi:hypothetical protein